MSLPLRLWLLSLFLIPVTAPAAAQIGLDQGDVEALSEDCPLYCKPGVRNRSQSRGVVVRMENQFGFDWSGNGAIAGGTQRVNRLEQFTFKFKIPIINRPDLKFLLGYEWDTEKYYFNDPFGDGQGEQTLFQLLDERRLKANKLSAYATKSFDDRFYGSARIRVGLNGDYNGLISFDAPYRVYSAAVAFGKKVNADKEWAVGITVSNNKARTIALPFFVYNKTFNNRWGVQTALPGQAFVRYNTGPKLTNAFLAGATFDSRYYAVNTDRRRKFEQLGEFYLRNNGVRFQVQYEQQLFPWVWAFAQGGYYVPVNTRFNPAEDISIDLDTEVGGRPFFRFGVFLAPPKELIR